MRTIKEKMNMSKVFHYLKERFTYAAYIYLVFPQINKTIELQSIEQEPHGTYGTLHLKTEKAAEKITSRQLLDDIRSNALNSENPFDVSAEIDNKWYDLVRIELTEYWDGNCDYGKVLNFTMYNFPELD